jgi:hypothetical protein
MAETVPVQTEAVDTDALADKVAYRLRSYNTTEPAQVAEIDYDILGSKIVQNMYIPSAVVEDIDMDQLADKLSKAIPAQEVISPDYIASKVAEQIVIPPVEVPQATPQAEYVAPEIDLDELSEKIAQKISIPSAQVAEVDEEAIARSVADKILAETNIAERQEPVHQVVANDMAYTEKVVADVDEKAIAEGVADRLNQVFDDQLIAENVVEKLHGVIDEKVIADAVINNLSDALDTEEIADCVAKKVGTVSPEEFDIMVDESGCETLANEILKKLDYEYITTSVVERLSGALSLNNNVDIDTEELAKSIAEKVSVNANINEDVIADKAASVLSNYLPEFDTDEIADKVVASIIPAIPSAPVIDYDTITNTLSEKIVESQEDQDFDIVIDEDGLARISESVSGELKQEYSQRLDDLQSDMRDLQSDISEVKQVLTDGTLTDKQSAIVEHGVAQVTENVSNMLEDSNTREFENLDSLHDKVDSLHDRIDSLNEKLEHLKQGVETATVTQNEKASTIETDDEATQHFEELHDEVESVRNNIDELKILVSEAVASIHAEELRQENINAITENVANAVDENAAKRIDELHNEIDNLQSNIDSIKIMAAGHVSTSDEERAVGLDEVSVITQNIFSAMDESTARRFAEVKDKIDGLQDNIDALRALVEENTANEKEETLDQDSVAIISDTVSNAVGENAQKNFDELRGEIITLQSDIDELKNLVAEGTNEIVLDEHGIEAISDNVVSAVKESNAERFDSIDDNLNEIRTVLGEQPTLEDDEAHVNELKSYFENSTEEVKHYLAGNIVIAPANDETAATEALEEQQVIDETETEEPETLVTVSDLMGGEQVNEEFEEEEPEEAEEDEEEDNDVIDEIVDDIDESPTSSEVMPDGIPGISGGVDFLNMMKYNRSFIARIIQGSDDVKQYYGQVKNSLLSYKKVNSNIAWGAERFNKGRETIARFKIRGKTLCLYLALDPNEYKTSVYHHSDVSDNKSMRGTPMMVKIKSPLGVRKAQRLIDEMLLRRGAIKQKVQERDYAAMYPYETIEELIEDGLVKDVSKK